MAEELVEMSGLQGPTFPATYERNGTNLKLQLRPGIITTDFLERLGEMYQAEKARAIQVALTQAATTGNRQTRRKLTSTRGKKAVQREAKAEGIDLSAVPVEGVAPTALDARINHMRFMAETCYRVVAGWNLARNQQRVELSVDEFRQNWDYDLLEPFFEFVCFEAAAPKK
jgi:hypothetical protein